MSVAAILAIVTFTILTASILFPEKPKAKPKSAKDSLDAALQQYLKELKGK